MSSGGHSSSAAISRHLPDEVRAILEDRFWRPIADRSTLEALPLEAFLSEPELHPALFADHGVVHARDVAASVVALAATAEGLLLPGRPAERQEFVLALAVLLAFIHDVGMGDQTHEGRRLHALQAAQIPFSGFMDDVIALLLDGDGAIGARIAAVAAACPFAVPADVVLRELAGLAVAHSKTAVPAAAFGDLPRLRRLVRRAILVDLDELRRGGGAVGTDDLAPFDLGGNTRWYDDALRDAYAWLDSPEPAHAALADDAVDAARLVRAADALRQRGTMLRTAAGYEIFVDADTGQAVFSLLTSARDRLLLLRVSEPMSAGEANVRKAEVTPHGNVRVSFHRGRFISAAATVAAVDATARVVADVATDVLGAFEARRDSPDLTSPTCAPASMHVELERPSDEPAFAELVATAAVRDNPSLATRIVVVADLESAAPAERARYLAGRAVEGGTDEAVDILETLAAHGLRSAAVDPARAFEDVRRVRLENGEVLVEGGSPPAFVYIPVDCTMRVEQPGGFARVDLPPWIPIGVTGVVRRAERNSTVVVTGSGEALMIPGELFVREWFRPYERAELAEVFSALLA